MTLVIALVLLMTEWITVLPTVVASVPRLEARKAGGSTAICSAVIFEIDPLGYAHALTAAHCVAATTEHERVDITVAGRVGVVLHQNTILDLAIVRFRPRQDRPIRLASTNPPSGSEVAVLGYAFGEDDLVVQFGHIAQPYNRRSRTTWVDVTLMFGDSGGALINRAGELVGINSAILYQGPARIGMVVSVEAIHDYLEYFAALKRDSEIHK